MNLCKLDMKFKQDVLQVIQGANLPLPMIRYGLKDVMDAVDREYIKDIQKGEDEDGCSRGNEQDNGGPLQESREEAK